MALTISLSSLAETEQKNNSIVDYSEAVSVSTWTGNGGTSLSGTSGVRDLFVGSSGTNTIVNYGMEDTIQFSVNTSSVIAGTDDVQLNGSGGAVLIVKNGKGRVLGVTTSATAAPTYSYYGGTYTVTPQTVIKNFMASLDNTTLSCTEALDEAINKVSNGKYATMNALIAQATLDCKDHGSDKFLKDDCGIILGNADTGAITGWDANNANVKTAISVVPETGSYDTTFTDNSFSISGLTFTLEKGFNTLTDVQKRIWQGLYTWWAEEALDLIKESYGETFTFANASVKNITVKFVTSGSFLAQVQSTYEGTGGTATKLELHINMKYYKNTDLDDVNGKSDDASAGYLDRVIAHELTHAIMSSTIDDFSQLPAYIKEGMAELTHGIDDERGNDISKLAGSASNLSKALSSATSTSKVSVSGVNAPSYAGGYILLKYMAKQLATFNALTGPTRSTGSSAVTDAELQEAAKMLVYNKNKTAVTVTADYTDTSLTPSSFATTVTLIDATQATKPMSVTGGPKAGTINIGAQGGTLIGGSEGADKLYGNSGDDVFVYSVGGGSDVVGNTKVADTLYKANDKIVIVSSDAAANPDGYINFKDAKTALTLSFKGDKKSKLTINKEAADTPVTIEIKSALDGAAGTILTHNSTVSGVSLSSNYATASVGAVASGTVVDASKINSQIKVIDARGSSSPAYLVGNTQATTIYLGSGGGTATGGYDYVNDKGFDDKFYGDDGNGADVFMYSIGGGKDQINGYNGNDDKIVLQGVGNITTITGSGDVSYAEKGSNLVLTIKGNNKTGTLTINNPLGQVKVYSEDNLNTPILTSGVKLPDYTGYNKNKTAVTLGAAADASTAAQASTIKIDLLGDGYSNGIKEIDASTFVGKVNLVGNGQANALRSAIGGGTLDGGSGLKATGDKLYGNVGEDLFVYRMTSVGGGTDVIGGDSKFAEGNYEAQDKVYIMGSTTALAESDITITDKNNTLTLKFNNDKKSQLTINRASSDTAVSFYLGTEGDNLTTLPLAFTHGTVPPGTGFGVKSGKLDYTTLTIGGATSNSTINTAKIHSQIKNIDMTAQSTSPVYVLGNAAANAITVGAGGGTVDGGAGNDKIVGNATASGGTTFIYTLGEGNDEINGYNGNKDTIFINGYTDPIATSNTKMFKDSGKDVTLTFTGTTKGKLTIKNTTGKLTIVGKDANGAAATLLSYGANLPDTDPAHMGFNANKTAMTIGSGAQLGTNNKFKLNDYGINLKELDASAYSTTSLYLIGSDQKPSILHAGSAGATLQGAAVGADKLYGNSGADTFVYSIGGGKDEIYSLDGAQGDEVILLGYTGTGIDTSKKAEFADSGKEITLSFTGGKLAIKNPTGQLKVYSGTLDETTGVITKSAAPVLTYDSNLPLGVAYNANKNALTFASTIASAAAPTTTLTSYAIDASADNAYSVNLKTVDASEYNGSINLTGNAQANVFYSGKADSTLNGGEGADKLYGTTGVKDTFVYNNDGSKDQVFNYDYAKGGDVIKLSDVVSSNGAIRATYNGKTLVLTYDDTVDNKKVAGTLTINGATTGNNKYANIDTTTKVAIQIGDAAVNTYIFQDTKIKNLKLNSTIDEAEVKVLINKDAPTGTTASSTQVPSAQVEEYWFTQSECEPNDMASVDELNSIMEIKPMSDAEINFNDFSELDKNYAQVLNANVLARHKNKK